MRKRVNLAHTITHLSSAPKRLGFHPYVEKESRDDHKLSIIARTDILLVPP